jgi:hypothetical protein
MEKNVVVKVAGAAEPHEAKIHPGTTCRDLLDALGLARNLLLTQDPAGTPFGTDESLFDKVADGQKLYAVPPMEVGKE